MWVFTQYYHEDFYPFFFFDYREFSDFEEMKIYSGEQSVLYSKNYPEYCSMYWKII